MEGIKEGSCSMIGGCGLAICSLAMFSLAQ